MRTVAASGLLNFGNTMGTYVMEKSGKIVGVFASSGNEESQSIIENEKAGLCKKAINVVNEMKQEIQKELIATKGIFLKTHLLVIKICIKILSSGLHLDFLFKPSS